MASPVNFPSGLNLAGTVFANGPATLQLDGPVYFSGGIQWLDTISGNDANAGALPELPVKTLAQAVTNSAANGIIVVGAGSSENVSNQLITLANLSIFGCGTGSSRPRYTATGAGNAMFEVNTGSNVWIEGFYFPASTAVVAARVSVASAACTVTDCYFECGANDTNRALLLTSTSANQARVDGCSFVVTASRPATGIGIVSALTDPTIVNCTFDGGSYGWSDYALKVSGAATRITYRDLTFINRSDLGHTITGTTYKIFGLDMGGTGNVRLDA